MCRLAGFIDPTLNSSDLIRMRDSMRRGGPDDAGIFIDEECHVHLGHRRLSFIDLSAAGHQPMSILEGKIQIIYNGELYNFKELRKELESLGHQFRSNSDTEVILYSYLQWGTDCFSRFNGMYAIVFWDKRTQDMILARDHAGIKPLYYSIQGEKLYFASELKAFKTLKPDWPERKDWKIYFLAFGHLPEPVTTLEQVIPLNKGSWLKFNTHSGKYTIQRFTQTHHKKSITSVEEAQSKIKTTLERAVQRHLISDAPIGLFLSGGIDSSLLTLLASTSSSSSTSTSSSSSTYTNLKTLSIYFDEEKYSEKQYQDIIVQKTGVHHQSFLVTSNEFNEELPNALEAMDSPSTDAINTYFISKYAHEYRLKAVLSGVGSDELFGGYPSMQQSVWYNQIKKLPSSILSLSEYLATDKYRKISFVSNKSSTGEYLFYRGLHDSRTIANILDVDEIEVNTKLKLLSPVEWNGEDHKEKASYLEYNLYMQNQLLKDADFMSMWHSLEIRVPFLDKEFADLVHSIPSHIRFQSNQPKGLLIDSFKHILPEAIWNRPKQGFTFPFAIWLKGNELAKPKNKMEEKYHQLFEKGRMSWGRYWGIKLLDFNH